MKLYHCTERHITLFINNVLQININNKMVKIWEKLSHHISISNVENYNNIY